MTTRANPSAIRWVEYCLWAGALLAFGYCAYLAVDAWTSQFAGNRDFERQARELAVVDRRLTAAERVAPRYGEMVGKVELPRIGLSAVVFHGDDERVLRKGVGHVPQTALPGESGNVVLAAHRDTFFRKLEHVKEKDVVALHTPQGTHLYAVESIRVVDPSFTEVLMPTPADRLTLITCYPFRFIGNAPERFVVQARRLTERPEEPREVAGLLRPALTDVAPKVEPPARRKQPRPRAAGSLPLRNASNETSDTAEPEQPRKSRFGWMNPKRWVAPLTKAVRNREANQNADLSGGN
jgi:sortase A